MIRPQVNHCLQLLISIVFLLSINLNAADKISIYFDDDLHSGDKAEIRVALQDAFSALPAAVQNELPKSYAVRFDLVKKKSVSVRANKKGKVDPIDLKIAEAINSRSQTTRIRVPQCQDDSVMTKSQANRVTKELKKAKQVFDHGSLKYNFQALSAYSGKNGRYTIHLNPVLAEQLAGRNVQNYDCGHRDTHKLALGAVIHQWARIFDASGPTLLEKKFLEKVCKEKKLVDRCQLGDSDPLWFLFKDTCNEHLTMKYANVWKTKTDYRGKRSVKTSKQRSLNKVRRDIDRRGYGESVWNCQILRSRDTKLSEDYNLLEISEWEDEDEPINKIWPRATTPFSYASDTKNYWATELEFLVLDSEYKCRKPAHYQLLQKKLAGADGKLFEIQSDCQLNSKVTNPKKTNFIEANNQPRLSYSSLDLNPKNVQAVHYFKAGSAESLMSAFGHSAYRLSICSDGQLVERLNPFTNKTESVCRGTLNDVILNYRANTMGLQIDSIKGLGLRSESYQTQLFISPFFEYVNEYAAQEVRNIYSHPIKSDLSPDAEGLSKFESDLFTNFALERHWMYYGEYSFAFANCADDAFRHNQAGTTNYSLSRVGVRTPNDVDEKLTKLGFANSDDLNELRDEVEEDLDSWDELEDAYNSVRNNKFVFKSTEYKALLDIRSLLSSFLGFFSSKDVVRLRNGEKAVSLKVAREFISQNREGFNDLKYVKGRKKKSPKLKIAYNIALQLPNVWRSFLSRNGISASDKESDRRRVLHKIMKDWEGLPTVTNAEFFDVVDYQAINPEDNEVKVMSRDQYIGFLNAKSMEMLTAHHLFVIEGSSLDWYTEFKEVRLSEANNIVRFFSVLMNKSMGEMGMGQICAIADCSEPDEVAIQPLDMKEIYEKVSMTQDLVGTDAADQLSLFQCNVEIYGHEFKKASTGLAASAFEDDAQIVEKQVSRMNFEYKPDAKFNSKYLGNVERCKNPPQSKLDLVKWQLMLPINPIPEDQLRKLSPERRAELTQLVATHYFQLQNAKNPYFGFKVKHGYGVPLKSELLIERGAGSQPVYEIGTTVDQYRYLYYKERELLRMLFLLVKDDLRGAYTFNNKLLHLKRQVGILVADSKRMNADRRANWVR
ncbi:MAG: hypothetical protein AB8E15_13530 [Bdellovibrionales bacterium]